jgi:hypothetical protein
MSWIPRYRHVSQLHAGPGGTLSGWNACWEACLVRYLCERNPSLAAAGDLALIDAVSGVARGTPDCPANADTTLGEAARSLAAYGITAPWTASFQDAWQAPWAICLVDGTLLQPAQYPASWFGAATGQGNHFMLWLPFWQGSDAWFNDPLAIAGSQQDCEYDLRSVAAAFYGAYLLPPTGNGEGVAPTLLVEAACALKVQPNHSCIALASLPRGTVVTALPGRRGEWQEVRTASGMSGWAPLSRLGEMAS